MGLTATIDASQFEEAIREVQAATGRGLADIVNGIGRDVSFNAIRETRGASKAVIEALPGMRQVSWTDPSTGKSHDAPLWCLYIAKQLRDGAVSVSKGAVAKVLRDTRKKMRASGVSAKEIKRQFFGKAGAGLRGKSGRVFTAANWNRATAQIASRMILNARARGINFLRAGFIPAARIFAAVTAKDGLPRDYRVFGYEYGVSKGGATVATPGENPVAELWNSAVGEQRHSTIKGGAYALIRFAGHGLQVAIDKVSSREIAWAEEKMARDFRKLWAV